MASMHDIKKPGGSGLTSVPGYFQFPSKRIEHGPTTIYSKQQDAQGTCRVETYGRNLIGGHSSRLQDHLCA
jgi:hypothetical protein